MKKSIKIILSIFFIVLFSCSENLNEKNELNYSEKDLNIAKRESTLDIQKLKDEYRIILTSESYYEYTTAAKEFVEFIPKDFFFSNHEEFTKWINDGSHVIYFGSVSNANKFYNNLIHKTTIFYQKYSEFYNDFAKLDEAKKNELILLEEELTLPIDFQQEINSGPCENTCINDAVDCHRASIKTRKTIMTAAQLAPIEAAILIYGYAAIRFQSDQRACVVTLNSCMGNCD
jgi:hypothetical protein